jgi:hypothetical protein
MLHEPAKFVKLIHFKVRIGIFLSDVFPIPNGLKQGDALSRLLFNFALEYDSRKVKKVKVKLSLYLTKHHTMKTYWGVAI